MTWVTRPSFQPCYMHMHVGTVLYILAHINAYFMYYYYYIDDTLVDEAQRVSAHVYKVVAM